MRIYRLEFEQSDGTWSGPYHATWLTPEAVDIRTRMLREQRQEGAERPWPDSRVFARSGGYIHYLAGTDTLPCLGTWFGRHFLPLLEQGGHTAVYEVPYRWVALARQHQVVFNVNRAELVSRLGKSVQGCLEVERICPSQFAPIERDSVS